ncbi:hypothetical protein ACHAXA_010691, partial [Cyclostephanos tholiformis]
EEDPFILLSSPFEGKREGLSVASHPRRASNHRYSAYYPATLRNNSKNNRTMVFFICDGCGESMKKAKVDAHAAKCHEYRTHTTCISEAERYEKSIFRGDRLLDESGTGHRMHRQLNGKKLSPQETWQETIKIAADRAPQSVKFYLDQLAILENVPRKEKQFRNFTVNSLRLKGPQGEQIKGEIWALLVKTKEEANIAKKEEEENKNQPKQIPMEKSDPSKETPDAAISDSGDEHDKATVLPSEKAVTKAMKRVLKKAPNKKLNFKALREKVQESLSFKVGKSGKKEWKKLLRGCVDANKKKMLLDGKIVSLTK